jgi:hypothetical protein
MLISEVDPDPNKKVEPYEYATHPAVLQHAEEHAVSVAFAVVEIFVPTTS